MDHHPKRGMHRKTELRNNFVLLLIAEYAGAINSVVPKAPLSNHIQLGCCKNACLIEP